jgi:hypothetical protein
MRDELGSMTRTQPASDGDAEADEQSPSEAEGGGNFDALGRGDEAGAGGKVGVRRQWGPP